MIQPCLDRSSMRLEAETLAAQVAQGTVRAIARAITLLENRDPLGASILGQLRPPLTQPSVIGVTGYPGTGKSTLIDHPSAHTDDLDTRSGCWRSISAVRSPGCGVGRPHQDAATRG